MSVNLGNHAWAYLLMVLASMLAVSGGMSVQEAFAMGDAPSTCTNRYDGTITSLIINNGTQTFDAVADPGVTFDLDTYGNYTVTFTIHTSDQSSENNSNPGTTWYRDDAFAYGNGHCVPDRATVTIGPGQDVAVERSLTNPHPGNAETQPVTFSTFSTLSSPITYNVNWMRDSQITTQNVQSASSSSDQATISGFDASAGTNRLLIVGVSANNNDVSSVTFGGEPLTQAAYSFHNNDAEIWYLANPAGTKDIVVTMNGPTDVVVGARLFAGVDQTDPIPTNNAKHNSNPNSPRISITTKYQGSTVLDVPSIWGGVSLYSPTCTESWNLAVPDGITGASSYGTVQSPSTASCSWGSSAPDYWDDVAVEIRSGSSGNAPPPPANPTITVNTVDSEGSPITDMFIELQDSTGSDIETAYSPATFSVTAGQQYVIYANSYGSITFDHWDDSTTSPERQITTPSDVTLTASYNP